MNSNRLSDGDHPTLMSFLSGDDRQGHASQSDEALSTQKQLKDEMSADLVDARKAEEDCKTNHAVLVAAEKRRSPVQQGRASVTSASKADVGQCFDLHPVHSTTALLCAGQVETTIEELTFESQLSVSNATVRTGSVREQPCGKLSDVTSTIEAKNAAGLVEVVNEPDDSRVQPTHHGGVWGFVP